ncbi:MAG: aldehyde dehydrogenase family protein [Candidatus Bipolaricaulia bacterium]
MFIDGIWHEPRSRSKMAVVNPATGEAFAEVPRGTEEDVDRALQAAARAFSQWKESLPSERASLLEKARSILLERLLNIARLLTQEQGKPLREAEGELKATAEALEYYSRKAKEIKGEILPPRAKGMRNLVLKQPIGPVVAIGPWNYPVLLIAWKVAPALAAGCTLVVKPASQTPLAVTEFVRCFADAGAPKGVINLVTGPGRELGEALIRHPLTAKVAFTGETETGRQIMRAAVEGIKRITLELGGHCPLIVAADADIEAAVEGGVYRAFRNMGQICNSINRIYVEEAVYEDFVEAFVQRTRRLRIANGLEEPDTDLGPMIDEAAREKTRRHIRDAVAKGAKILYGGKEPEGEKYKRGYFFEPTVLTDVNHEMIVMTEETFGPVAPIMKVSSLEEAINYANDSIYGLVAYLYTQDLDRGLRAAEALEYGTVGINNVAGGEVEYPYGGWKQSGLGIELSEYGLEEYLLVKHIRIRSLR